MAGSVGFEPTDGFHRQREAVDEILDGFLKELSEDYGFHIYRPMIITEKESGCEVFTEFPYDEYDIDGVDEPEDEEDETETGE